MAPIVFTARRRPERLPLWWAGPARSAADAGKLIPMTNVVGSTTRIVFCRNAANEPDSPKCASRTTIPPSTRMAVATWVTARTATVCGIRWRMMLKAIAPSAIPVRNVARIIVKR